MKASEKADGCMFLKRTVHAIRFDERLFLASTRDADLVCGLLGFSEALFQAYDLVPNAAHGFDAKTLAVLEMLAQSFNVHVNSAFVR